MGNFLADWVGEKAGQLANWYYDVPAEQARSEALDAALVKNHVETYQARAVQSQEIAAAFPYDEWDRYYADLLAEDLATVQAREAEARRETANIQQSVIEEAQAGANQGLKDMQDTVKGLQTGWLKAVLGFIPWWLWIVTGVTVGGFVFFWIGGPEYVRGILKRRK